MPWHLWFCIFLVDVTGLVVGALALWRWRRGRSPSAARDTILLLLVGGALALGAMVLARLWLHSGFAMLRLWCHVLFCVLAPLMMLRGVFHVRRGNRPFGLLLLLGGLLMEGVYVYARHAELADLEVNHHGIRTERLSGIRRPIRVIILADLQTDRIDSYEERVFRTMDDLRPDLILLAGDYLQVPTARQFQEQQPRLRALLNGMRHQPRLGILAVTGDVDYCGDAAMALSGTNVRCLNDEAVELGHGSRLQVIGLTLASSRRPPAPETWQQIRGFEGFTILLGHAPDYARTLIRDGCDLPLLCVAGHTHGGQVVVPGFGPVLTLSRVPRKYASGFHQIGNGWLLVSRGVGHECGPAPRIRLCCRPELVVVDLQPADPQPADPQPGNMRER